MIDTYKKYTGKFGYKIGDIIEYPEWYSILFNVGYKSFSVFSYSEEHGVNVDSVFSDNKSFTSIESFFDSKPQKTIEIYNALKNSTHYKNNKDMLNVLEVWVNKLPNLKALAEGEKFNL